MATKTRAEMAEFLEQVIFHELVIVREQGQQEYAHDNDNAFANFERQSIDVGITREQVLLIYLGKHMDGIKAYIKGHKSQREPVQGRIKDAMMYLALLWGMVDADQDEWHSSDC
jgi:hypothetical protein